MNVSMEKIIIIPDEKWEIFLKIAFKNSDSFCLKYFTNEDYYDTSLCEYIERKLNPWRIFNKGEIVWPDYEIRYYECNYFTMKILTSIKGIDKLGEKTYPEDLSFFINEEKWFENVSHEKTSFFNSLNAQLQDHLAQNGMLFI